MIELRWLTPPPPTPSDPPQQLRTARLQYRYYPDTFGGPPPSDWTDVPFVTEPTPTPAPAADAWPSIPIIFTGRIR
jgi:hypothetical protein